MQDDGEDGEQTIDVGLEIQRFIGLGAVRFSEGKKKKKKGKKKKKKSSTADQLIRFDSFIRNAFAKN